MALDEFFAIYQGFKNILKILKKGGAPTNFSASTLPQF